MYSMFGATAARATAARATGSISSLGVQEKPHDLSEFKSSGSVSGSGLRSLIVSRE